MRKAIHGCETGDMIYLLCGVPGSGKTWVIDQLKGWSHIDHDSCNHASIVHNVKALSELTSRNIIIDCPFNERALRKRLQDHGLDVTPIFIVESPDTIYKRYMKREGREPSQAIMTRATSIMNKVVEWQAFYGTSQEVLDYLRGRSK